jgi:hypothetical protein
MPIDWDETAKGICVARVNFQQSGLPRNVEPQKAVLPTNTRNIPDTKKGQA